MSKLKKILLMCIAYVLVAAIAIGGTLAYLTSQDDDVNVMTTGNVKIEQIEQQYDENGNLVDFKQDKPLYPYVGTLGWKNTEYADGAYRQFTMNNVVDKYVSVKNTGKSDAYVRTLIAFEMGDFTYDEFTKIGVSINLENGSEFKFDGAWNIANDFVDVIDGYTYNVMEFVHAAPVKPGETTVPSLLQVYLSKDATNEDVKRLDGNGNGKYDIIVISQATQTAGFENANSAFQRTNASFTAAKNALDTSFGVPEATNTESGEVYCVEWFTGAIDNYEASLIDTWDGTADTSWYNDTDTEFVITTAEQLAGLAKLVDEGNTFEGKTIKLDKDLDLYVKGENGEAVCFDPIGSYRKDLSFKGTFDGQGYTISNMSQNTWALDNGYEYGDLGLGLFGKVRNATIKNLTMDNASISGESAICGTVAATAYGECTFDNITVKNSKVNDYQYYAGGVVGWASGNHTYKNINMDASTIIGSQWGDFGNANGGIIGGIGSSGNYHFEDCTVACRIDATNDVVSAYQWYNYRNSGMLIGKVPQTIKNGEVQTVATPNNVTCKNVTVIYGDWANYTYCEFAGTGYPFVRVQAGVSVDAYSNVRYGHPTDANGNTVVDDNHVHNDGEAHHELIAFNQLFGGPADHRYCYYGINAFDGVNVVYNNK